MGIKMTAILGVMLSTALMSAVALGDVISPCSPPSGVKTLSLEVAPLALTKALNEKLGTLASPESDFDSTDVVATGLNRRLIFVWNRGNRWIIATEHGGRGYNDPVLSYDLSSDGLMASFAAERTAFPKTVCSTALTLLDLEPRHL